MSSRTPPLAITYNETGIAPVTTSGETNQNPNYHGNMYNLNHRHTFGSSYGNNRPNTPRPARPTNTNAPTTLVSKFKGSVKEMNGHVFQCYEESTAKINTTGLLRN